MPTASLHLRHRLFAGSVPGHRAERWNRQVSRVPLHDVGVTAIVETCTVSSEGVTPHSSLLRTHAPILSGSPPFGFSLVRGVCAGCHQPLLPAGSSRRYSANLSSDAWSHATAVPQTACACFFVCVIGLPLGRRGSASRFYPRNNFSAGVFSRAADISLRSSLRVCSPPRLSLPLCIQPQGS